MIKTFFSQHVCQTVRYNEHATVNWIARVMAADFSVHPYLSLKKIMHILKDKYGLTGLHKSKASITRMMARGGCNEAFVEVYSYLRCYAHMVLTTNPSSAAVVQAEAEGEPPHFKRIFMCPFVSLFCILYSLYGILCS